MGRRIVLWIVGLAVLVAGGAVAANAVNRVPADAILGSAVHIVTEPATRQPTPTVTSAPKPSQKPDPTVTPTPKATPKPPRSPSPRNSTNVVTPAQPDQDDDDESDDDQPDDDNDDDDDDD